MSEETKTNEDLLSQIGSSTDADNEESVQNDGGAALNSAEEGQENNCVEASNVISEETQNGVENNVENTENEDEPPAKDSSSVEDPENPHKVLDSSLFEDVSLTNVNEEKKLVTGATNSSNDIIQCSEESKVKEIAEAKHETLEENLVSESSNEEPKSTHNDNEFENYDSEKANETSSLIEDKKGIEDKCLQENLSMLVENERRISSDPQTESQENDSSSIHVEGLAENLRDSEKDRVLNEKILLESDKVHSDGDINPDLEDEKKDEGPAILERDSESNCNSENSEKPATPSLTIVELEEESPDKLQNEEEKSQGLESSKPEAIERCVSRLTDGDVISLDSSDDEEPKTIEEVTTSSSQNEISLKPHVGSVDASEDQSKSETKTFETDLLKEIPSEALKKNENDNVLDNADPEIKSMLEAEANNYEIFYNKECINYECPKTHKQYYRVTQFTLSFYNISKKRKAQFVCTECYSIALEMYEELCGALRDKQPILIKDIHAGKPEFVEILDSSDEDEPATNENNEDPPALSAECLDLIERELINTINNTLSNIEVQNQLTWTKTILGSRLKNLEKETKQMEAELKSLQSQADKMNVSLYSSQHIKISNLPPLDLNSGKTYIPLEEPIKPFGDVTRPDIEINGTYYAVKNKPLASWVPCRVIERIDIPSGSQKGVLHYKVKFIGSQYHTLKTVPIKHMAYFDSPPVRLQIGTRVIAYFDATTLTQGREKCAVQSAFYPGIIAEPLKLNNRYRYLIFYDDGYTQYVHPNDVRLVCQQSEKVWEDVHPGSRDFIENYVTQYNVNRPMVQTHKGQTMNTESNGTWIYARVVDIDCSLVKMHFEQGKGHTEWIYRGSLRLGPVFREYHKMQKESNQSRLRRTEPFIRYTADDEMTPSVPTQRPPPLVPIQQTQPAETQQRAVARKTTSRPDPKTQVNSAPTSFNSNATSAAAAAAAAKIKHLNNETIYLEDENIPKGKVVYYTAKRNLPPRRYKSHQCNKSCLFSIQHNLNVYSPLSKPLLSGWERMIMRQKVKKSVVYRAPCGKMLRDMLEVRNYLRATENVLNVDNFDFRPETCCLAEYVIDKAIITKRDITNGLEKMPLPLVNYYDTTLPDCTYAAQRIPKEDVHINTDIDFLVGCDCEDDCLDKSKCSCWQLTLEGAKYGNPNTSIDDVGYQYKRLMEAVPTGIYECNARCKCKSNCLNRVVQHPLQMKLQVFKTNNRGWGLRCINDIPKGSFICIYAGNLLTNTHANEGGLDAGDEYFAELDLIETAEQYKEGYESDVVPPEPEEEDEDSYHEEDDEFRPSRSYIQRSKKDRSTRSSQSNEESNERRLINFNPNADLDESRRKPSIRQFYGNDDGECYVMDAKTIGNLGRYFNHSCSPNLFVQSVFVDTHDLRFPWVAFFAILDIRAGTELTWNYNYEVGVVPGKVLYCECGAPNCRQRLL